MERDFFQYLPSELTTDILSRLPFRSLVISKSVCKPWLNLIDSDDFRKSEIKTPPALVLLTEKARGSTWCSIFEFEDEDAEKSHDFRHIPLMDLEIPHGNRATTEGITANGLLLLYSISTKGIPVYICNLITREYTELCLPADYIPGHFLSFGFGVSKISGQCKVVCNNDCTDSHHVYTLGTGTWRRVEGGAASGFTCHGQSVEYNGNIHWRAFDVSGDMSICGFDVETECFRLFSIPPVEDGGYLNGYYCVLRDCLCYYYTVDYEIRIWMMKKYLVEDSWTLEYKLSTMVFDINMDYVYVHPIKHFKDGDILMLLDDDDLVYYSNKTRTFQQVGMFRDGYVRCLSALTFTPSRFSLKNFGFKNVISF